jgi:glycosyltransferase involved in cell wall biosynthesis
MRLMQVMAGGPQGGAEAFFERLVIALDRSGIEQTVAVRKNPKRSAMLTASGLSVSQMRFGGKLDLLTLNHLKKLAKSFQPDVTLAWMSRASSMAPKKPGVLVGRLGGYYKLKYYKRCQHLIGNTQDIVDYLVKEGWPAERAHYLPNFVSVGGSLPEGRLINDTPDDVPILLSLGRLHKNKGFDVLLAALAEVPHAVLWLAGAGPEAEALKGQARALGVADRVRWLGWRDDVAALYRAADVFVCPSRHEPLGNVVIEAWAHNTPVVAAASNGPASLLTDGVNGRLVPKEDARALAMALNETLADQEASSAMAAAGHAAYAEAFSEAVVVQQYRDFFEQITR